MDKMKLERHEKMYGKHFDEKCAEKAVAKMHNEDGTMGAHWSIEEAAQIAQQFGVNIKGDKFNKYDWFVALNMVRSDFYKAIINMTGSDNVKHFVELTKAWLNDKDIETGKMWMYFKYVMCDAYHEEEDEEEYEEEYVPHYARRGRGRMYASGTVMGRYHTDDYDYDDDDDDEYESKSHYASRGRMRVARYMRY